MREAPKAQGSDIGGRKSKAGSRKDPANAPKTLSQQGIDKHLAARPQSLRLVLEPETIIQAGFDDMDSAVG